jgi:hypothetical protein
MTKSQEIQKAKDLLKSVGYHVSWWNVDDVKDNYDISFQEAQHCLESVLHGKFITDMVKEEINEFAYESDYKINN